jgi:hypothetical protein
MPLINTTLHTSSSRSTSLSARPPGSLIPLRMNTCIYKNKLWDEATDKAFLDHSQPVLYRSPFTDHSRSSPNDSLPSRASPALPFAHLSTAIFVSSCGIPFIVPCRFHSPYSWTSGAPRIDLLAEEAWTNDWTHILQ